MRELLIRNLAPVLAAMRARQGMAIMLRLNRVIDKGIAVAVVGGLDSPIGALLGGLVVGIAMTLVTGYLGATVAPIGVLVLLVGVLLVKPGGIFSMREARSA